MVCSSYQINKSMLSAAIGVIIIIIIGAVEMDHFLDGGDRSPHKLGLVMTILGYSLLSVLVAIDEDSHKFNWDSYVKRGIPALVVGASAIICQRLNAKKGLGSSALGLGVSAAAWVLLATVMVKQTDKNRSERQSLFYGSAVLVNVSLVALFMNRKYNVMTGKWDGPQNVFGMGLPLLTLGWMMFAVGLSMC